MKKLQYITATTFMIGLITLLFFTFGQLTWDFYDTGLYTHESLLLIAWMMLMFGTSFYYSILRATLYPEVVKKSWENGRRDQF